MVEKLKVISVKRLVSLLLVFSIFATGYLLFPVTTVQAESETTIVVEPTEQIAPFYNVLKSICIWSSNSFYDARVSGEPDKFVKEKNPYVEYPILMTFTGGRGNLAEPEDCGANNNWYTEDDDGNPQYDFAYPLESLKNVLRGGVKPIIVIGQVPNELSIRPEDTGYGGWYGNKYGPKDYGKYYDYIKAFAQALVDEFGLQEVRSWKFRMYTEPDNGDWYLGSDDASALTSETALQEFLKMYDYTEAALADVIGEDELFFFLGNLQTSVDNLDRYLNHFAYGTNYYSGKTGTKCDALSMSQYFHGTVNVEPFAEMLSRLKQKAAQYPSLNIQEIGIGEGSFLTDKDGKDMSGGVGITEEYGSVLARMFDLGNGSAPGYFANWDYHTDREYVDSTKPVLPTCSANVGELLVKLMSGDRVSATAFGGSSQGNLIGQMASYDAANGKMYVLLYNHNNDFGDTGEETLTLNINNVEIDGTDVPVVKHWRVDRNTSNFGTQWLEDTKNIQVESSRYAAEAFIGLNQEQQAVFDANVETYRDLSQLTTCEPDHTVNVVDNTINKTVTLPHHSVSLLEISNIKVLEDPTGPKSIFVNCGENGTVEPSGNQFGVVKVPQGQNQTFTFAANEGYAIQSVKANGVDVTNEVMLNNKTYTFSSVDANHNLEVSFMKVEAELPWIDTTKNYVGNFSFEETPDGFDVTDWTGYNLSPGSEWTKGGNRVTGDAVDGNAYLNFWHEAEYSISKGQIIKEIPNGTYKLTVYSKNNRGAGDVYMYANTAAIDDFSVNPEEVGTPLKVSLPANVSQWTQYTINDIEVTNGQVTIGFVNDQVQASCWTYVDKVELTRQNETFIISPSTGEGGRISPEVPQKVEGYQNKSYTITPDPGYMIDKVIVDAGTAREKDVTSELTQGSGKSKYYTFMGVAFDHTIDVTFKSSSSADDNYVRNYSFEELNENSELADWTWYDQKNSPAWAKGGYQLTNDAMDGYASMCFWHDGEYSMRKGQIIENLPNGVYTLSVYAKTFYEVGDVYMYANPAAIDDFSVKPEEIGTPLKVVLSSGTDDWTQFVIDDIQVTNGQLTIGFVNENVEALGWTHVDNVALTKKADLEVQVTGVSLDKSELLLGEKETASLNAEVLPENAVSQGLRWSSDNEAVAVVDTNGKVTAVSAGNAVITVTTLDGNETDACQVKVSHDSVKIHEKVPTETEAGNIAYWHCIACGKCFSDDGLTKEISKNSTIRPATGGNSKPSSTPESSGNSGILEDPEDPKDAGNSKQPDSMKEGTENPGAEEADGAPATNDNVNLTLWIVLMLFVTGGIALAVAVDRKREARG